MPDVLRSAALYSHLFQKYGFRTVSEMEAVWSNAQLTVVVETDFHANYMPPRDDRAPGHPKPKEGAITRSRIGGISVQRFDG